MQAILIYLLKVSVCSALLLGWYWIALRNKQFNQYNRFYLLSAVAASLVLPLLRLEWFTIRSQHEATVKFMEVMYFTAASEAPAGPVITWQLVTGVLLTLSFVLLLLRLALRVYRIYRVRSRYPCTYLAGNVVLVETDLPSAPFSFLSNLFWRNDISVNEAAGQQMLQHEITHIREKHTWDKLFMQLVLCFFWMNPFFWLLQRELYLVHEFIADSKAIQDKDASAFATMLLQAQFGKFPFSPAQPFFYSPIKRRLLMLTTSKSPSYSYARRVMALPLLGMVCMLLAIRIQAQQQRLPLAGNVQGISLIATSTGGEVNSLEADTILFYSGADTSRFGAIPGSDTPRSGFGTYQGQTVTDVFVNSARTKVIITLADKSTKELSYREATEHKIRLPFQASSAVKVYAAKQDTTSKTFMIGPGGPNNPPPIYVLDGKIINHDEMLQVKPNEIQSIDVLKGETAKAAYGEKGENGVIILTSKTAGSSTISPAPPSVPTKPEISPAFQGGAPAWRKFLEKNINPDIAVKNGAPVGTYTAIVAFDVDINGKVSNIRAVKDPGYGVGGEAVRLLTTSPNWLPAIQDGKPVKAVARQAISFVVAAEK